jgi:hypothetical protein
MQAEAAKMEVLSNDGLGNEADLQPKLLESEASYETEHREKE